MTDIDPTRFSADPGPAGSLAHALRSARRHGPSPADLQRVAASLPLAPVAPVAAGAATSLSLKIGAGMVVVALAVFGVREVVRERPRAPQGSAAANVVGTVSSEPTAPEASMPDASPPAASSELEPTPSASIPTAEASVPTVTRPGALPAPSSSPSGPSEAALLLSAKSALASNPERALALTEEHKRRFPDGKLAQEREVIAIAALQKLGRGGAAKAESDRFKEEHPGSIHQQGSSSPNGH